MSSSSSESEKYRVVVNLVGRESSHGLNLLSRLIFSTWTISASTSWSFTSGYSSTSGFR